MTQLSPSQQNTLNDLLEAFPIGSIFVVWAGGGMGKTTILQEFHRTHKGEYLTMKNYIDEIKTQDPFKMEETLEAMLMKALDRNDLVILDDLDLIYDVICGCGYQDAYPRAKFVDAILTSVVAYTVESGKKLVIGNEGRVSDAISKRSYYAGFRKYTVEDFKFLCEAFLGARAQPLDFAKIYRFAPKLTAHQLKSACLWHRDKNLDTEVFIEYLRSQRMASNVDLGEVEAVDLRSLRGLDDVIECLEANIILPLEQDALAAEYEIKPKRGVLLAGPPGTGKTTVGRALAHRLRSKFFLIDGTFISGTSNFYGKIAQVFENAKNNAPSIIFIDDSDVIFEDKEDFGLYRYLLTMLDGLEGESNKRICVMMTTMDVASVPPALVRSGRIELWLETRLPDESARLDILKDHSTKVPQEIRPLDLAALAKMTEGLTGADLRRLIEDGKILYAYDKSRKAKMQDVDKYYQKAVETIRSNKDKYLAAEERAREKNSSPESRMSMVRSRMMARMSSISGDDDDDE